MNRFLQKIKDALMHPLAKGSLIILVGSMLANVGAYAYHVLVGRLLGPVIYGEFSALLSLFYIINIGSGVVQTILAKFFHSFERENFCRKFLHFLGCVSIYQCCCVDWNGVRRDFSERIG